MDKSDSPPTVAGGFRSRRPVCRQAGSITKTLSSPVGSKAVCFLRLPIHSVHVDPSGLEPLTYPMSIGSFYQVGTRIVCGQERLSTYRGGWFSISKTCLPTGRLDNENPFESGRKQSSLLPSAPYSLRSCGPERTRTAYLLIANEAFYQMNYGPIFISPSEIIRSIILRLLLIFNLRSIFLASRIVLYSF